MSDINDFVIEDGVLKQYIGCDKKVVIPQGVKRIGEGAFRGNLLLEEVEIPYGVIDVGDCAFSGCNLLKSLKMPNSVESIGEFAFFGSGFENITLRYKEKDR